MVASNDDSSAPASCRRPGFPAHQRAREREGRPGPVVLHGSAWSFPRGVRIRLWLLLGYLAIPIELVPDFIPGLGYADDAIIVTVVLRSVVRRGGLEPIRGHWPGTEDGLAAVLGRCGLADQPDRSDRT
jgi:hypothetical protein